MFNVIFQSINDKGEKNYSGLVAKEWSFSSSENNKFCFCFYSTNKINNICSEDFNYEDKNDNYGEIVIDEIEFLKIDDTVVIKNNVFLGF